LAAWNEKALLINQSKAFSDFRELKLGNVKLFVGGFGTGIVT
jgi:hypothetical protein